ncbi:MAG TPA: alpha/beta hydrolase-fold protein [Terracidiphilus sp.]|jgi:S-formylglutathione hydrolase FrmB|nr:alpha/beta hydrolase-fold protein [Terracidiphilus sp.]
MQRQSVGKTIRAVPVVVLLVGATLIGAAQQESPAVHTFFRVQAAPSLQQPVSGRLLIFLKPGTGDAAIDNDEMHPTGTWICAREVQDLKPADTVDVDCDETAFPQSFSQLSTGVYEAQAVLDVQHDYNYRGRTIEDWVSPVVTLAGWHPGSEAGSESEPEMVLDHHPPDSPQHAAFEKLKQAATSDVAQLQEFQSPLLTRFWGRPVSLRAWVVLPPGYSTGGVATYPTAYWTHGFGGDLDGALVYGLRLYERMKSGSMPPMIWVMLDESCAEGTHEFADSANNGPWGAALTAEFIPYLESKYRMDARRDGRFLNGHSSGGWATLQLEVDYPKIFGGTWSTSPDPSDFHDFTGIDLYAPHANVFHRPDGSPYPIERDKGKVIATFEQMTRMEDTEGAYGGQIKSFDWVFSPKSPSGAPEPMFDHATGDVHPDVVAYWHDHYDLANIAETRWAERGPDLKGRIHLYVGTADTFYLDGAAHKMDAVLARLGADAQFHYIPGRTHFDLYTVDKDRMGLFDEIAAQMWQVARPGEKWRKH